MGNPIRQLGTLRSVPIRDVWEREDRDFTPWLLNNGDRLSEALGIDVELRAAEHAVGTFSLDLLGRIPGSDEVLIVENQLEESDHKHLGQLLTYAGGTEAHNIVWIATRFREEHRSAVDWLNENTNEGVRFFAVEISAVQIGDSPPAPLFNVVAKPNDWGKAFKASAAASGMSERDAAYRDFWEQYLAKVRELHPDWTKSKGNNPFSWIGFSSGVPNIELLSMFYKSGLSCEIYTKDQSHEIFHTLLNVRDDFEREFGGALEWDEVEERKSCKITTQMPGTSITSSAEWGSYIDWLIAQQVRLRATLEKYKHLL
jgi:hypothetical protein